jgi:glycosyltransferase involved in cell wall biosynthesis
MKHKMNVIFLSPVAYFKGGAERSLFDLMANPGITPVLLVPDNGEVMIAAQERGITCEVLPFGAIETIHRPFSFMDGFRALHSLYRAAAQLKIYSKKYNAQIVHSNGLKAHAINCVSKWIGGARAVLHIRDIPYTKPEKLVWKIFQILCDHMVLVSKACWPGEALPQNVSVIHNGTPLIEDTTLPAALPEDKAVRFGFCGRIHPAKGLHLLVDWLAAAREKGLAATLSVRGTFSDDAPDYEQDLKNRIKEHGLSESIEFTGFINSPEKLYEDIDIVVVPSQTPDPLPRSVMEAMARGLPVFGYPAGGITEMIEDRETGFLVKDAEDFVTAVEALRADPQTLKNMSEKARARIAKEFTLENLYAGLNRIYERSAKA